MSTSRRNIALWFGAVLGVPLTFAIYVLATYRIALRHGALPFGFYPEWYWFAAFAGCLLTGLLLVYFASQERSWLRVTSAIFYVPLMAIGLLAVHSFVACASGDCI